MSEPAGVLVFDLMGTSSGAADLSLQELIAQALGGDFEPPARSLQGVVPAESMNRRAIELSSGLEAVILSALPAERAPAVQVELRFRRASISMAGTVAVSTHNGASLPDTAAADLAEIVRLAAQCVVGAALAEAVPGTGPVQCIVTPRPPASAGAATVEVEA